MTDVIQDIDLSLARVQNVLEQGPVGPVGPAGEGLDPDQQDALDAAPTLSASDPVAAISDVDEKLDHTGGTISTYSESSETITITAGAGSFNHSTAKSIVKYAMVAATTITISGWSQGKPITLRFSNATPDILTLTNGVESLVSGTDFDLNGAAGEVEWLTLDHEASRLAVVGQGVVSVLSV